MFSHLIDTDWKREGKGSFDCLSRVGEASDEWIFRGRAEDALQLS